jgi:hypothetical protein
VKFAFSGWEPGPVIMLRSELPYVPATGVVNAAVLKNSSIVGSASDVGSPL